MSGVEKATILPGFYGALREFYGALHRAPIPRTGPGINNNNNTKVELHDGNFGGCRRGEMVKIVASEP